jgi:beta-glucoside operon transcriptional antiterminator
VWIVKNINNSCALGRDTDGQDVVVFGKGIGFRKAPYELTDLSRVSRTFYGVKASQVGIVADVPEETVIVASDIINMARVELGVKFNPNAAFILADHINFALRRVSDGLDIETPLAQDIKHFFPRETRVGREAVRMINERLGIDLPEAEVANVTLHLIDAETEQGDIDSARNATCIVRDVTRIVERVLGVALDTEGPDYARFVTHLRYLTLRIEGGVRREDGMAPMLATIKEAYPTAWDVSRDVVDYFRETWNWTCDESETLYLLIHVQRLKSALEGK